MTYNIEQVEAEVLQQNKARLMRNMSKKLRSHHTAQKLIRIQEKEIYNTIKQDD